ncbi:phosphoribosylformylglycinamidine cyclo-ligase [Parvimonas micra]|uniref:phosphoribosylformylglycinamidine cyclo-ligase n=1 Tax=Parvimonas micra TaxID=33033 RepID=UPI0004158360|nr:phosphoribosylformylglycinamidine cyclo-ligase [Parvimonas micra]
MALTYKSAGVNKHEGYNEVNLIKKFIKNTYTKGVLSDLGGFSGLFELGKDFKNPVLVSGTDGVGTKVKLAQMMDAHNTVGIDCVAMCVNDILCQGAKPLFFLDYIATGKLVAEKMASIVEGVAEGCIQSGSALIGGETAEMPGIYKEEDYDIAGFCVGVVEKDKIIDGKKNVKKGNVILALPSSGVHSNGFSLVRKIIFDCKNFSLNDMIETGKTLGEELLTPTKIYAKSIVNLLEKFKVNGLCHITGGGIYENVPRVLGDDVDAKIIEKNIPQKEIFSLLQRWGEISKEEMYGTFNMGIGMLIFVEREDVEGIKDLFKEMNEEIYEVGEVVEGNSKVILC